jgi:hypothetical protein
MGNIACYLFLQSGLQQKKKTKKKKTCSCHIQKIFKEMGNIACYLFLQSGLQQKKKQDFR